MMLPRRAIIITLELLLLSHSFEHLLPMASSRGHGLELVSDTLDHYFNSLSNQPLIVSSHTKKDISQGKLSNDAPTMPICGFL